MAELINNVKMRLILPNNDQESFVNAINYNFHQLANIANHVDAKRGEKGEQGLPGAQGHEGPKGDRGAGIYVYDESIYGKTSEGYANFLKDNGITKSDFIMYSGKIYDVDAEAKYITDYDSETPSVDFTKDVKQAVIDIAGDANGGMARGKTNNACAYIIQKSANDLYGEGASDIPEKENCVPAVFANGYQPDQISTLLGQAPDRYSISSLKKSETYNIRLGIENFSQYYSVIDFKRDSGGDGGKYHTDFDICKDGGNGNLQEVSYNFSFENEPIVSIFKNGSDKSINLGKTIIFSGQGYDGITCGRSFHIVGPSAAGSTLNMRIGSSHVMLENGNNGDAAIRIEANRNILLNSNNENAKIDINGKDPNASSIDIEAKDIKIECSNSVTISKGKDYLQIGNFAFQLHSESEFYGTSSIVLDGKRLIKYSKEINKKTLSFSNCWLSISTLLLGPIRSSSQTLTLCPAAISYGKANETIPDYDEYYIESPDTTRLYILGENTYIGSKTSTFINSVDNTFINSSKKVIISDSEHDDYLHTRTIFNISISNHSEYSHWEDGSLVSYGADLNMILPSSRETYESFIEYVENETNMGVARRYSNIIRGGEDNFIYVKDNNNTYTRGITTIDNPCYTGDIQCYQSGKVCIMNFLLTPSNLTGASYSNRHILNIDLEALVFIKKYIWYYSNDGSASKGDKLSSLKSAFVDSQTKMMRRYKASRGWRSVLRQDSSDVTSYARLNLSTESNLKYYRYNSNHKGKYNLTKYTAEKKIGALVVYTYTYYKATEAPKDALGNYTGEYDLVSDEWSFDMSSPNNNNNYSFCGQLVFLLA